MTKGLSAPSNTRAAPAKVAVAEAFVGAAEVKRQQPSSPTQLG